MTLRSDICVYSDPHIVVKGTIDLLATDANENDKAQKKFAFKKNAPFQSCISKINSTLIENAEDLGIVMSMCSLLVWNCYRNETDNVNDNASCSKLFKYKTKVE